MNNLEVEEGRGRGEGEVQMGEVREGRLVN